MTLIHFGIQVERETNEGVGLLDFKCLYTTKDRIPLILIYSEKYGVLSQAREREQFLKSRSGRRELKKIFEKVNIGE